MPPDNQAVVLLNGSPGCPLEVKAAPYTPAGPHELVVRNHAVAVNPVEPYKQLLGKALLPFIKYPCVQGSDLAGEVVEVGEAVSAFAVGDRVLAYAAGTLAFGNRPPEGAFQLYTVVREHMTAKIPGSLSFERACVLPLCFTTAAYGLFHRDFLGLDLPTTPTAIAREQVIFITSGSSSVGACAVQLAAAAGYEVYSTATPSNFELVRRLGAKQVFDYREEDCAKNIASVLQGKKVAGAMSINPSGVAICAQVLRSSDSVKFIADAGPPPPEGYPEDIPTKFIDGLDIGDPEAVIGRLFREFIPTALETGQLVAAPEPEVVARSLAGVQEAFQIRLKGVSARKIVVSVQ